MTLLSSLDKWERLSVADALEPASFSATEVIMKQGDLGDAFYIIIDGRVRCISDKSGVCRRRAAPANPRAVCDAHVSRAVRLSWGPPVPRTPKVA